MSDKVFVDTNILIYRSFGTDVQKKIIHDVLKKHKGNIFISTQILNEFVNASVKKSYFDSEKKLKETIFFFASNFYISQIQLSTVLLAIEIRQRYGYSHYDSVIIATSLEQDCKTLYSEDLHHGQTILKKLKIINPFAKQAISSLK